MNSRFNKNLSHYFKAATLALCLGLPMATLAGSSVNSATGASEQFDLENQAPKECLKDLEQTASLQQAEQTKADASAEQAKNEDDKEQPSWFEKLVKQHKLGSLHFQDIIELFH